MKRASPLFVVVGKPSSGKGAIANFLASTLSLKHLSPDNVSLMGHLAKEAMPTLKSGQAIQVQQWTDIIQHALGHDASQFQGAVLECVPQFSFNDQSSPSFEEAYHCLHMSENYRVVFIEVDMPDQKIMEKRVGQKLDPKTGYAFSKAHIDYSIQQKARMKAGLGIELNAENNQPEEEEDNEPEEAQEGEEGSELKTEESVEEEVVLDIYGDTLTTFDVIHDEILSHLVDSPDDSLEKVQSELNAWNHQWGPWFKEFIKYCLGKCKNSIYIPLDGTQTLFHLRDGLLRILESYGINSDSIIPPPQAIPIPEEMENVTQITDFLIVEGLRTGEPNRELGKFQYFCPVSYVKENEALVLGLPKSALIFKGKIYFFASMAYRDSFLENPFPYIGVIPRLKNIRVCFVGYNGSGKTTQATKLSQQYDLPLISMDKLLEEIDINKVDETKELLSGRTLPTSVMIKLLKDEISRFDKKGWIIDGFPTTKEQAESIIALQPTHLIVMDVASRYRLDYLWKTKEDAKILDDIDFMKQASFTALVGANARRMKENLAEVSQICEQEKIQLININVELSESVINSMLRESLDPFYSKTVEMTLEDPTNTLNVEFGYTKDYCPVTLANKGVLLKGDYLQAVKYESRIYFLAGPDEKRAFTSQPALFAKPAIPTPIRIAVVGPLASGKSTIVRYIKEHANICHIDFDKVTDELNEQVSVETYSSDEEREEKFHKKCLSYLQSLFISEPYKSSGFVLEGFPNNDTDLQLLHEHGLFLDHILILSTDTENCLKRLQKEGKLEKLVKRRPDEDMTPDYNARIERSMPRANEMQASSKAPVSIIDGNRCQRMVLADTKRILSPYLQQRGNLFLSPRQVEPHVSVNLLAVGLKQLPFQRHCPVSVNEQRYASKKTEGSVPIIVGDDLYMLLPEKIQEFTAKAYQYIGKTLPMPLIKPNILLMGRPKSGKTGLAKSLAQEFDILYISMAMVLNAIVQHADDSLLNIQIRDSLVSGKRPSAQQIVHALVEVLKRSECQSKGWILDDFPLTAEECRLFDQQSIVPLVVLNLEMKDTEISHRMTKPLETEISTPETLEMLQSQSKVYDQNIEHARQLYSKDYHIWFDLNGHESRWKIQDDASSIIKTVIQMHQKYHWNMSHDLPAIVSGLHTKTSKLVESLGSFQDYCPVSMVDHQQLQKCQIDSPFLAEYQGRYYITKNQENMDKFINNSEHYLKGQLPTALPTPISIKDWKDVFPRQVELKGYCPVTFAEGNRMNLASMVDGKMNLLVEYEGKLYAMASEAQYAKFLATPWKFVNLSLPKKLPPPKAPLPIGSLPVIGYLEQTVATVLTEGLTAVGKFKPKHPYKNLNESARMYLAYYLKANNPRHSQWMQQKYKKRLEEFESNCQIIRSLVNAFHQQKNVQQNKDLDQQFERLLQLNQ